MRITGTSLIQKISSVFKIKKKCKHKFILKDLKQTGIKRLDYPKDNSYNQWGEYYKNVYIHPSHTKRVQWACSKCGEIFYAHCGLDIINNS